LKNAGKVKELSEKFGDKNYLFCRLYFNETGKFWSDWRKFYRYT